MLTDISKKIELERLKKGKKIVGYVKHPVLPFNYVPLLLCYCHLLVPELIQE